MISSRSAGSRLLSALVVVIVAAALPGCGEETAGDAIIDVTRQFAADAKAGDWNGACGALSARARAEMAAGGAVVGGKGCAEVLSRAAALDDSPEVLGKVDGDDVKISDIKIAGDRATAEVLPVFDDGEPTTRYVREDGEWKLDTETGR